MGSPRTSLEAGASRGAVGRALAVVRATASAALLLAAFLAALVLFELFLRTEADVLAGVPRVVDGDTLEIGERNVRLAGLDAPERAQDCTDAAGEPFACGRSATDYLRFLIDGRAVTCRGQGTDRWQRLIARCRVNGVDLSEAMIRRGWAVAFMGDLEAFEVEAREAGVGMWAGEFVRPADWRRERRSASIVPSFAAVGDAARTIALWLRGEPVLRAPADE